MTLSADPRFAPRNQKIIRAVLGLCVLNWLVHAFGISAIYPLGFYPSSFEARIEMDATGETAALVRNASAWFEFLGVQFFQLFLSSIFYGVVFLREVLRFFRSGSSGLVVTVKNHLVIVLLIPIAAYLPAVILLNGFSMFEGTRLGGFPPGFILLVSGIVVMMTFVISLAFLLESKTANRVFGESLKIRFS